MTIARKALRKKSSPEFYLLPDATCPYFAHRKERKLVTLLEDAVAQSQMDLLISKGFRRMRDFAFAPRCRACKACIAYRLPVQKFRPSRQQKRVIRTHHDLTASLSPPKASLEQFALFKTYQRNRHQGGSMQEMDFQTYRGIVEVNPIQSAMLEIRERDGRLVCTTLLDFLRQATSATYTFFAPDVPHRSYGIYAILQLIALCQTRGLQHLYLGHWIADSPKMAYKSAFQPAEVLIEENWLPFESAVEMRLIADPKRVASEAYDDAPL